jgi:hypothetical protein
MMNTVTKEMSWIFIARDQAIDASSGMSANSVVRFIHRTRASHRQSVTLPSARNFSLPMNIAASSDASVTAATTCAKG